MTPHAKSDTQCSGRSCHAHTRLQSNSWLKEPALDAVAVLAYTILTAVLTYPLLLNFTRALPGDGVDGWAYYWNLWWNKRALCELHTNPFFTNEIFYPYGTTLYFHTSLFFPSLLALPIVELFGLTAGYNFLVMLSFILAGYGAYRSTEGLLGVGTSAGSSAKPLGAALDACGSA